MTETTSNSGCGPAVNGSAAVSSSHGRAATHTSRFRHAATALPSSGGIKRREASTSSSSEDGAARHLEDEGYTTRETNCVQGPTFSADGKLVAISEGFPLWWLPEPGDTPEEEPSPGGTFQRGRVTLVDVDLGSLHQFDVFGEVDEVGAHRTTAGSIFELLGKPSFVSHTEIEVSPEFGKQCRITVHR